MPNLLLLLAFILTGCMATDEKLKVLSHTPASIDLTVVCTKIDDTECRQLAANTAQAHCQASKQNAQYVRSAAVEADALRGVKVYFVYSCIR